MIRMRKQELPAIQEMASEGLAAGAWGASSLTVKGAATMEHMVAAIVEAIVAVTVAVIMGLLQEDLGLQKPRKAVMKMRDLLNVWMMRHTVHSALILM